MIVSFVFVGCKGAVNPENPDDTEQSGGGGTNNPSGSGGDDGSSNNPSGSGGDDGGSQIVPSGSTVVDVLLSKASGFSENDAKFIAEARYSTGEKVTVTTDATWSSSDTSVATVDAGVLSILGAGTTEITATYESVVSGNATVTVTENVSGGTIDKLYFITNENWKTDNARFAAYFFDNGEKWVDMTLHAEKVYVCDKQEGYPSVIFCRMNPATTDNKWDNRWDQTADLTIPSGKDTYQYDEGGWNKGTGKWLSDLTGSYSGSDTTYSVNVSINNTNNYVNSDVGGNGSTTVTLPNDWNNLRIYQVMVSSFQDGDSSRGYQYAYGPNNALKGGDLQGIINAADYIESLGCNAIWMTPIFNSNGDGYLDSTGYFTYDYFDIDPKFGTKETFKKLVQTYHDKGIYVILDGVFGHHKGSTAKSPSGKSPAGGSNPVKYPGSLDFYKEVATYWIKEFKIDGWRLDQCYQVGLGDKSPGDNCDTGGYNYWYDIRIAVEQAAAENKANGEQWGTLGYMVGEHWNGDASKIQEGSINPGKAPGYGLKSCFDFPSRYRLIQTIAREEGNNSSNDFGAALTYTYGTSTEKGYYHPDGYWPNLFITNHDLVRLGNLINWKFSETPSSANYFKRHKVAMAVLAAYSGPITIYYGDEWGAYVDGYTGPSDLGAYNDNVARSTGKISGFTSGEKDCLDYSSALMKMRSENPVLWSGTNQTLKSTTSYYVGKKTLGSEEVIFIINNGTSSVSYNCSGKDMITGESVSGSVTCDGLSARFIKVK